MLPMHDAAAPTLVRRIACMAYESLLVLAVLITLLLLPHTVLDALTRFASPPSLLWAHALLLLGLYFGWFWSSGRQTPAMKTWKIQLLTARGGPLTPGHALLRLLLASVSLAFCGIGILWALVDREGQFLHDRLAGTRLRFTGAPSTRSSSPPLP